MGWTNSHLHSFTIGDERYGIQYDEYPEGEIDEKTVKVGSAIGECRGFLYEYDPDHEEYESMIEWAGGPIDPTSFDLVAVNVALQGVR